MLLTSEKVLSRTQNDELQGLAAIVDYIAAEVFFLPLSLEYRSICAMIKVTIDA